MTMRLTFSNHLDVFICLILFATSGILFLASYQFQNVSGDVNTSTSWLYRLTANLSGYAIVFIPGYLIIKYINKTNYIDRTNKGFLWPMIKVCIYGPEGEQSFSGEVIKGDKSVSGTEQLSFAKSAGLLFYCFVGLQGSYLVWGLLQEKIMTQRYDGESFTDSQFLVFINRILALVISWGYLGIYEKGKVRESPLYKYSYCAFSNIMSSWFQYEALKFVSFPTQVLAKACKIIPVMLMGKLISKQTYEFYEYFTAILISFGMILFLSGSGDSVVQIGSDPTSSATTIGLSGLVILISYMVFDSFTSNWQSELFKTYRMSSVRMMAGVNLFSCLLTGISLIQQGTLTLSFYFMLKHRHFFIDCIILSVCSAVGQLYIYYTIEKFGAVIFITIMTVRQALAVLLSCVFYSHPITGLGVIGVFLVFLSVFLRIYCSYRLKQIKAKSSSAPSTLGSSVKVINISKYLRIDVLESEVEVTNLQPFLTTTYDHNRF